LVKPGGTVTFIFPGDQEQRLYALFAQAFRQIDILPLLSFAPDTHPIRVVLQGWTSKEPARVHRHPGFVLHEESRTYTPAADAVLRAAQATVLGER
jgi:tRNA1(Val) A37 N6-methylase TrmN6